MRINIIHVKKRGSVLIVTKRMRSDTTEIDALSRIFKFGGNAVICISAVGATGLTRFSFKLIDALGNVWVEDRDIAMLIARI